ncbi:MAG: ROK family protein [Actinomycetota bacterium]
MSEAAEPAGLEAIGLDIGGTKIAGFRVSADGRVLAHARSMTPAGDSRAVFAAVEQVAGQLRGPAVAAIGAGVAGMVEYPAGIMRYGPNLPFRDIPLREWLAQSTGLPCLVDNDAACAGWGEFRMGAGREADDMLLVTVGTGIGGAIVSGGRMFRGAHGFGAEIGHIIVEPGGPLCGCGNLGCWEQVASGRAIGRLGREAAAGEPASLLVELAEGDPALITGPVVTTAAKQGDVTAVGVLAEVGRRLGEGIAGLVNVLDPDVVVVGGGAIDAGDLLLGPARTAFVAAVEAPEHRPQVPIVAARLGNDAGGIGAGLLALEEPGPGSA